jgi:hypothetical protein
MLNPFNVIGQFIDPVLQKLQAPAIEQRDYNRALMERYLSNQESTTEFQKQQALLSTLLQFQQAGIPIDANTINSFLGDGSSSTNITTPNTQIVRDNGMASSTSPITYSTMPISNPVSAPIIDTNIQGNEIWKSSTKGLHIFQGYGCRPDGACGINIQTPTGSANYVKWNKQNYPYIYVCIDGVPTQLVPTGYKEINNPSVITLKGFVSKPSLTSSISPPQGGTQSVGSVGATAPTPNISTSDYQTIYNQIYQQVYADVYKQIYFELQSMTGYNPQQTSYPSNNSYYTTSNQSNQGFWSTKYGIMFPNKQAFLEYYDSQNGSNYSQRY